MLLSKFSDSEIISACPNKLIGNKCEQNIIRGEILNDGENVDDQGKFGFTESYFKIPPTNIDGYTKNKILNMQQENLIPQINIDNN